MSRVLLRKEGRGFYKYLALLLQLCILAAKTLQLVLHAEDNLLVGRPSKWAKITLGAAYPDPPYAYEGDSPAIFHLIPNGLHDPTMIDQGGWGGRFAPQKKTGIRGMSCMSGEDQAYDPYGMYNEASESISRWKGALQNDFEARMDWSITSNYGDANHHPIAVVNGDTTGDVLRMSASAGSNVALSRKQSLRAGGPFPYRLRKLPVPLLREYGVEACRAFVLDPLKKLFAAERPHIAGSVLRQ